jgi:hypothetical protein
MEEDKEQVARKFLEHESDVEGVTRNFMEHTIEYLPSLS